MAAHRTGPGRAAATAPAGDPRQPGEARAGLVTMAAYARSPGPSGGTVTAAAPDPMERWATLQRHLPYGAIAIGALLTTVGRDPSWPPLGLSLVLSAAAALWVWVTVPGYGRLPLSGPVFYAGWTALCTGLVLCSPWNGFAAFLGYLFALELLPGRWAFVGVGLTACNAATSQLGGLLPTTPRVAVVWVAVVGVNAALAGAFSYYGRLAEQQHDARKQTVAELAEANARLAAAMAENAGLQAQLLTQARAAGVLDERARLAREIHDTIAQGLAGIVAQLQAAQRPADRDRHLDTAAELARDTLAEARRSVQALRPEPLETARLPEALAAVVTRWSEVTGVEAGMTTTGDPRPLHPEVEVALLRTGQEALANAGKHAGAARVGMTLSYMEDVVTLDVRDDGIGFDPGAVPVGGAGFGLSVMRQRVARVAGTLAIESAPGEGTAVSATVPAIPS